jgi:hypothetical protein
MASEPDNCTTKGWRVVANRTLVGVVWIIERTPAKRNDGGALPPFHEREPLAS